MTTRPNATDDLDDLKRTVAAMRIANKRLTARVTELEKTPIREAMEAEIAAETISRWRDFSQAKIR